MPSNPEWLGLQSGRRAYAALDGSRVLHNVDALRVGSASPGPLGATSYPRGPLDQLVYLNSGITFSASNRIELATLSFGFCPP